MSKLAEMLAKQNAKPATPPAEAPKPAGLAFLNKKKEEGATVSTPEPEGRGPSVNETETITTPNSNAAPKAGLAFLKQRSVAAPAPPPPPVATQPDPTPADATREVDLDSLMNDTSGGTAANTLASGRSSRFADEVPAQGPVRELPEDLDKQQRHFIESLDSIYRIVHKPDLLGNVVKSIMMELSRSPEYRKMIQPMDVHTMIKGMRDSMGMARIKKEESKAKRAGGAKKKTKEIDGLDGLLDSLDADFS